MLSHIYYKQSVVVMYRTKSKPKCILIWDQNIFFYMITPSIYTEPHLKGACFHVCMFSQVTMGNLHS